VVKRETWTPDPAIYDYFPEDVSGNVVNGVGERAPRRPSPIFWHRPDKEAFGKLQEHVVARFNSVGIYHDVYAYGDRGPKKPDPVAAGRVDQPAAAWTRIVKDFALANEADLVGIARVDPQWIFEGYELADPFVSCSASRWITRSCRRCRPPPSIPKASSRLPWRTTAAPARR